MPNPLTVEVGEFGFPKVALPLMSVQAPVAGKVSALPASVGELFGSLPSYKALVQPHAQVHASVHAMLPYLDQGWEKDLGIQQAMYQKLQDAEEASKEVMRLLDQMVREKHGD